MTVEENLRLGAYTRDDEAGIVKDMDRVYELFPVLGERRKTKAGLSPAASSRCSPWEGR